MIRFHDSELSRPMLASKVLETSHMNAETRIKIREIYIFSTCIKFDVQKDW